MSKIEVSLDGNVLIIEKKAARKSADYIEKIPIELLEYGKKYKSHLKASSDLDKNKLLFIQKIDKPAQYDEVEDTDEEYVEDVIFVYSNDKSIMYSYCNIKKAYTSLVKLKYKIINFSLNKKRIKTTICAYLINKYNLELGEERFYIDNQLYTECKLSEYPLKISKIKALRKKNFFKFKFPMNDILSDESTINGPVRFTIDIDGNEIDYKIGKKEKRIKNKKYYYNPIKAIYVKDYAVHIRRNLSGAFVLVKRLKEPIENTFKFKILESKLVSYIFYYLSKIMKCFRRKKINVFYEKYTSKVEEGAYDLFLLFQEHNYAKNYFIITKESDDYEKIKDVKGVLKKYSLKYYWVMYNADNCIATEAPLHLSIIRSNNGILRKNLTDKKFIFLQHGITYLKCHGSNSAYIKNREAAPDYMICGSEKEKDVIVDMLKLDEEQVINTGLPIFSKIKHEHINNNTEDYITIMMTWKPYEEHLYNFEESETYKNTIEICDMLKKYIDKEKIIIISHPKAFELISNTDLKESLWDQPISKALEKTKLLITDYSSVCYNSFYQGAGVIFYQPDLEFYEAENGKLIPSDEEYIGKRAYNMSELEDIIKDTIIDKKINLNKVRTKEFEKRYLTINEFTDGKNINRIYEKLKELEIV